jgi:HAD superfamily hydrolase (TIGR01662 family)
MPPLPGPRYPYVLFDLGSTLIYFNGDWPQVMAESLRACTRALRQYGYQLDEQAFPLAYYALIQEYTRRRNEKFIEFTAGSVLVEALATHRVPDPAPAHVLEALKAFYTVSQRYWQVEEDAHPTLSGLRAAGCRLGIVSNASDDADVQELVDQAAIRPYFDFVLTSALAGVRKPHPLIFQQALANWPGVQPGQVLMVGDLRSADIAGANNLGLASAWITRRALVENLPPDDPRFRPTFTISSLSDLLNLI